jgi:hypothetical protein
MSKVLGVTEGYTVYAHGLDGSEEEATMVDESVAQVDSNRTGILLLMNCQLCNESGHGASGELSDS